jgi:hypothetical protein
VKSKCKVVLQIVLFVGTLVSATQSSARATEITFLCAAALVSFAENENQHGDTSPRWEVNTHL